MDKDMSGTRASEVGMFIPQPASPHESQPPPFPPNSPKLVLVLVKMEWPSPTMPRNYAHAFCVCAFDLSHVEKQDQEDKLRN